MKAPHNATGGQRRASVRNQQNAQSTGSSLSMRLESYSYQASALDHAILPEGQSPWPVDDAREDELNLGSAHPDRYPIPTHEHVAFQQHPRYDHETFSEVQLNQVQTDLAHNIRRHNACESHPGLSVPISPIREAGIALESSNTGQYTQSEPMDFVFATVESNHGYVQTMGHPPQECVYLQTMGHPPQDCVLEPAHEDPWKPQGIHPIPSPQFGPNPSEGYGISPTGRNANTDDESPFQNFQQNCDAGVSGILHTGSSTGNREHVPSSDATRTLFSAVRTPNSSDRASYSDSLSHRKQDKRVPGSMSKSVPDSTQFAWDSKNGEPLGTTRTKRRQSKAEKLSSQEIRRLGGPCVRCQKSHRKVTTRTALLSCTH